MRRVFWMIYFIMQYLDESSLQTPRPVKKESVSSEFQIRSFRFTVTGSWRLVVRRWAARRAVIRVAGGIGRRGIGRRGVCGSRFWFLPLVVPHLRECKLVFFHDEEQSGCEKRVKVWMRLKWTYVMICDVGRWTDVQNQFEWCSQEALRFERNEAQKDEETCSIYNELWLMWQVGVSSFHRRLSVPVDIDVFP